MDKKKLQEILELHKKWLNDDQEWGLCALYVRRENQM